MALKVFREDPRRARLEAIKAPKAVVVPQIKIQAKPVEAKPVLVTDTKITQIKKETV